jgi:hypothetical protein
MPGPLDFKKESKNLYQPKTIPVIVDVPKMHSSWLTARGTPMMNRGNTRKQSKTGCPTPSK